MRARAAPDPVYVTQSLLPSLLDFWHKRVTGLGRPPPIPAFQERDRALVGVGNLPGGCASTPSARKAPAKRPLEP